MKRNLTEKYMDGTASHREEQMLLEQLRSIPSPTGEERGLMAMLQTGGQRMEGREEWLLEDESELFDRLKDHGHRRRPWHKAARWMAAAAVLAGVCMVSLALWRGGSGDVAVIYIYGNRVENAPLAMDMMRQTMGEMLDRPEVEAELMNLFDE